MFENMDSGHTLWLGLAVLATVVVVVALVASAVVVASGYPFTVVVTATPVR